MAEALIIGGWFASFAVAKLCSSISSLISSRYHIATGVKSKLQSIKSTLVKINTVIEAVERTGITEVSDVASWASWLNELKDVVYDVEDILDAFNYESLCHNVEASGSTGRFSFLVNVSRNYLNKAQIGAKRAFLPGDNLRNLSDIVNKLDRLSKESVLETFMAATTLMINSDKKDESSDRRQTTPVPVGTEMFGRSIEKDQLLKFVLASSDKNESNRENFSLVSIVGIGGVGKTTLAQWLYNYPDVQNQEHFDLMAWVCVSDKFNMRKVMTEIIESASGPNQDLYSRTSFGSIHEHLSRLLRRKRFLIVLDDVWDDMNTTDWDKLISVFRYGKEGSKIVVTTRSQIVVDKVKSIATIKLACLKDEESWQFFSRCAFADVEPKDHPKLEHIGKQIASKLGGLPLAAKVVGGVLRQRLQERHWMNVLENKEWQKEGEILPSLRLSYNHLPTHLKQCFPYCALYPKDYRFKIFNKLIDIWVAQGCVQSSDKTETLESVGRKYFKELFNRYFFSRCLSHGYVIHDLMHDLAESIFADEIFRVENDSSVEFKIPKRVRHLFVGSSDLDRVLDQIEEPKKLRTLVYEPPHTSSISQTSCRGLEKLRGLRVLILGEHYSSSHLPKTIGNMLHLRFLEFPLGTKLPISVGKLYNLDHLALSGRRDIDLDTLHLDFPNYWVLGLSDRAKIDDTVTLQFKNDFESTSHCFNDHTAVTKIFGRLTNLRYISAPRPLFSAVPIGKLTSLHNLLRYEVRKQEGYRICELRNLNNLRNCLLIVNLENVADKEEAKKAELHNKVHLHALSFWWNSNYCSNDVFRVHKEVLEGLQPHSNIISIGISRYMGLEHPSWLNKSYLSNIECISLLACGCLKALPPLGEFPFLKLLSLKSLMSLEKIGLEAYGGGDKVFPSLQFLILNDLKELREWSSFKENMCNMMPLLYKLEVTGCNKLEALPPLGGLQRLINLHLSKLGSLAKIGTESYGMESEVFPKLKNLLLSSCEGLKEWLAPNEYQSLMPHLTKLYISNCPNLKVIPPLGELPSLRKMQLEGLHSLEKIGVEIYGRGNTAFPSLKKLNLSNMSGLTEWCAVEEGQDLMPHLQVLEIINCHKLRRPIQYTTSSLEELKFGFSENVDDVQMFHELFPVGSLTCLKSLSLGPLMGLESLTSAQQEWFQSLTSLRELRFYGCSDLRRLPDGLGSLCCLESLTLSSCPEMVSLGQNSLPMNLKDLQIISCAELQNVCEGPERSKISHIPQIKIQNQEYKLEDSPDPFWMPNPVDDDPDHINDGAQNFKVPDNYMEFFPKPDDRPVCLRTSSARSPLQAASPTHPVRSAQPVLLSRPRTCGSWPWANGPLDEDGAEAQVDQEDGSAERDAAPGSRGGRWGQSRRRRHVPSTAAAVGGWSCSKGGDEERSSSSSIPHSRRARSRGSSGQRGGAWRTAVRLSLLPLGRRLHRGVRSGKGPASGPYHTREHGGSRWDEEAAGVGGRESGGGRTSLQAGVQAWTPMRLRGRAGGPSLPEALRSGDGGRASSADERTEKRGGCAR